MYPFIIIMLILFIAVVIYSYFEAKNLRYKEYEIKSAKIPEAFDGFKIAFLSDIHAGITFNRDRLIKLCENINSHGFDIILLGGDYVLHHYDTIDFYSIASFKAPHGVIGVYGNHDARQGERDAAINFKNKGWTFLINEGMHINKDNSRIYICGVDDFKKGIPDVKAALNNRADNEFTILLSHNPDPAPSVSAGEIDIMLCGHTHGGQITFFGYTPLVPKVTKSKYLTGICDNGRFKVITSNGIGTVKLPLRLFAPPQVVTLTLRSERNEG